MSVTSPSIDAVWARLRAYEGEEFHTTNGLPFTYVISGDVFRPSRTDYDIPRSEFAKALVHVPFDGPGAIGKVVRGPSYVWAVLHDKRISQGQW
jgi:hypothetical protein